MPFQEAEVRAEGLNLRRSPEMGDNVIGVLLRAQRVQITGTNGPWRRVESPLGSGFVHHAFIAALGAAEPLPAADPEVPPEEADRTGSPGGSGLYQVMPGDTMRGIGLRLGIPWREVAAANHIVHPYLIRVNQILRVPRAGQRIAEVTVGIPLATAGVPEVTASSAQGHHRPYGGTHACDLDFRRVQSPGEDVTFQVDSQKVELQGRVRLVGPACRSGEDDDGGRKVQIALEYRAAGQTGWLSAGAWILYAHLDPVTVAADEIVAPGTVVGRLGPATPLPTSDGEYESPCAGGSHVHVEATRGVWVASRSTVLTSGPLMRLAI